MVVRSKGFAAFAPSVQPVLSTSLWPQLQSEPSPLPSCWEALTDLALAGFQPRCLQHSLIRLMWGIEIWIWNIFFKVQINTSGTLQYEWIRKLTIKLIHWLRLSNLMLIFCSLYVSIHMMALNLNRSESHSLEEEKRNFNDSIILNTVISICFFNATSRGGKAKLCKTTHFYFIFNTNCYQDVWRWCQIWTLYCTELSL